MSDRLQYLALVIGVSMLIGGAAGYMLGLGWLQGFTYASLGVFVNVFLRRVGLIRNRRRHNDSQR